MDRGLQAYRHVDALYGKPAVAVATRASKTARVGAAGGRKLHPPAWIIPERESVVRATFPGDAIVSEKGGARRARLAAALVSPDDYIPEGVSCPECKGTYFEFRKMDAVYCLSCGGTGTFSMDGGKIGLAIGPPAHSWRKRRRWRCTEVADPPAEEFLPRGAVEGRREAVPRRGIPLMRKRRQETRRNIIEKSLQIFSVKGTTTLHQRHHGRDRADEGGLYATSTARSPMERRVREGGRDLEGDRLQGGAEGLRPAGQDRQTIENDLRDYCAERCSRALLLFNMLVELSGQSPDERPDRRGFMQFSDLLASWLEERSPKANSSPA